MNHSICSLSLTKLKAAVALCCTQIQIVFNLPKILSKTGDNRTTCVMPHKVSNQAVVNLQAQLHLLPRCMENKLTR